MKQKAVEQFNFDRLRLPMTADIRQYIASDAVYYMPALALPPHILWG